MLLFNIINNVLSYSEHSFLLLFFIGVRSKGLEASQVGPWMFTGVNSGREGSTKMFARKISKDHLTLLLWIVIVVLAAVGFCFYTSAPNQIPFLMRQ